MGETAIDERGGAYVFDMWIPKGNNENQSANTGRYQALMEEDNLDSIRQVGFVGLDDLF